MRTGPPPADFWDSDGRDDVGCVDWKDGPYETLEQIDGLLSRHGLEVVMIDTKQDNYAFSIEPREKP